jgi:type I restriction enzyme S subunit
MGARLLELVGTTGLVVDGDWVESKDQDPQGDVRLIQLADIGDGRYRDRSARFLTAEKAKALRCTMLRRDDVLIARMPDPLGRACLFPGDDRPSVTVVDVCIFRAGSNEIIPGWIMHAINAAPTRARIATFQSGTTRKRISGANLQSIEIPLPPTNEQRRIVDRIDELFSLIEAGERALERARRLLERYRQSVLKAAVSGELTRDWRERHQGEIEPGGALLTRILKSQRQAWEAAELEKMREKGIKPKDGRWKENYRGPDPVRTSDLPELPMGWVWASLY